MKTKKIKSHSGRILRSAMSVLVIICLISNLAFAGRRRDYFTKDPQKAFKLGIICPGLGHIYAGNTTTGIYYLLGVPFFGICGYLVDKNDSFSYGTPLISSIMYLECLLAYGLSINTCDDYVEKWNSAVRNNDYSEIIKYKKGLARLYFYLGLAITSIFFLGNYENFIDNPYSTLKFSLIPFCFCLPSVVGYTIEANSLPKSFINSNAMIFPIISPKYQGIMVAKRF